MDASAISSVYPSPLPTPDWDAQMPLSQISNVFPITYYHPGIGGTGSPSPTGASTAIYMTPSRNQSPESLLSVSSAGSQQQYPEQFHTSHAPNNVLAPQMEAANASYGQASPSEELTFLRERVRQLEQDCRRARAMVDRLRGHTRPPHSSSFHVGWEARTAARIKKFCSPNRAGNALCAWHDSRRERRVYPPRNAPKGYLNCGCTYEQALFEESLSRHDVGGYLPGESVRMDPALRNPLLTLLQKRYGYEDGDFERDLMTETWMEGQSPQDWQRICREGKPTKARKHEN